MAEWTRELAHEGDSQYIRHGGTIQPPHEAEGTRHPVHEAEGMIQLAHEAEGTRQLAHEAEGCFHVVEIS